MRPHLPLKLRSALLAALVAVSFTTYSPAWAEEENELTQTKVYEHNETWTKRITDFLTLDSYAKIKISNKSKVQYGGAIYLSDTSTEVGITNSGNIFFENNSTSGSGTDNCYGGAVCNRGTLEFSGNGDIAFSNNTVSCHSSEYGIAYGGAVYNDRTLEFTGNGDIAFSNNTVSLLSSVYGGSQGGAIYNNSALSFTGNGNITFSDNSAHAFDYFVFGGAVYNDRTLEFTGNGDITFSGNSASVSDDSASSPEYSAAGGAIYNYRTLTFESNGDITFSGNSASVSDNSASSPKYSAVGGAVYNQGTLEFTGNGDITFTGNSASYNGGAVCNWCTLEFTDNGDITFSDNSARFNRGGGAVYNNSTLEFTGNGDITFSGNSASASYGGAIYNYRTLTFESNGDNTFTGNSASYNGGAIYNYRTLTFESNGDNTFTGNSASYNGGAVFNSGTLEFTGNGDITFSGNSVSASYSSSYGGAVYNSGSLTISGNGDVTSRSNLEKDSQHCQLRSLYSAMGNVTLSATSGKVIAFSDSIYTSSRTTLELNKTYEDANGHAVSATGSIVFTGETTEADLVSAFERNGITDAPTVEQITESRTSVVGKATTLYGGSLVVREQAVLNAKGLTIKTSADTVGGTRVVLHNGTLNSDVDFESGTSLHLSGANSMTGTLSLAGGAGLVFDLSSDTEVPLLSLTGTLVQNGALTITVKGGKEKQYVLLAGDISFDSRYWNSDHVTVKGASLEDLLWQGDTLVINRTFSPFDDVILDGEDKEIGDGETITPEYIEIGSDSDSCIMGGGSIAGDGKLSKTGSSNLTISTANPDWTGEINISSGTVTAGTDTALGTGAVKLNGGGLDLGEHSIGNDITVNANATFNGGGNYQGSLTLHNGTLTGGGINIAAGKTFQLENGTLSNRLTGKGGVKKLTTGTVTLNGANTFSGGTAITAGTLTAGNAKAFGTGDISISGGTLAMGGLAVANTINIGSGSLATISNGANFAGTVNLNGGTLTLTDSLGGTLALNGGILDLSGTASTSLGTVTTSALTQVNVGELSGLGEGTHTVFTLTSGSVINTSLLRIVGADSGWKSVLKMQGDKLMLTLSKVVVVDADLVVDGGTLDMKGKPLTNTVVVNATSASIKGGKAFAGNLTLTKGTLTGDAINLASGKTATLQSGSLKNVLSGAGKVVKETTGTVYVYGANTYTGGTTIKAGTLAAKNVKAFGTGGITVTGGTLHMGGYALTNTVNVNGTTAVINCASAYRGNLTLTKGTLSGQNINLYTGKTATLKAGTVKNVLAGAGKVVKDTTGTAYLFGANTYTGGTTVKAGTLSAKNAKALGTGTVSLTGGTLHLNSLAVTNTINSSGTTSIKGGTKYAGNLTLTKGTLTGDKVNLASGKTATLKSGSLKNVLAGAGKVVKDTTGTAYLFGANTYTGGTTVKAGTLSAKNVKALGTKTATLTGGTLHLNSLAVANDINVNGTSSIKGGTKYKGKLTLTKGTLSGDKINLTSGKNAYLKAGTVKNALGGNGHVYKQGTGTVTLSGTNNWTGNTYVQGGTMVITGATTLRGTTRTYSGSKLDIRKAVTMGNLYLGGGTLALKAGNMLTVTGTLTLANATKLALSGVMASNSILIKYGKLSNTSKKSLAQFFGLTSAYTVTNKGGKLTIAKAGSKKGTAETLDVSPNALGQSTWGTARAARLFDHTVRDHAQAQSVALDKNRSVWFAAMSGFSHVDDAADTNIYGGAIGMQFNGSMGGNAGIAIGQTYGHVSPAGATRVKQQTQHAALYGTKMLYTSATDSVSLTGTASYGTTDSDHETLDWTQHSAVLGVRGTWEHKVNQSTAVYGFAGLEYLATDAECGSGSIQALQGSIGAGISHTEGRLTLHANASFTPDMVRNAPSSTVNPGRLGFEVSAGASYRLSDKWSLNAGYTYHNEKRSDSHEAYIGARCTF